MKKAILASVFLLAFTLTAVGQKSKKLSVRATTKTPTEWTVNQKPVWELADAYEKGLKTDQMIIAVMPEGSLKLSADGETFEITIYTAVETDSVRVNGNTITWRDILVNGRPYQIRYKGEYYFRYKLSAVPVLRVKPVAFSRIGNEKAEDFIVFGEGFVGESGWKNDGDETRGNVNTSYMVNEIDFNILHVYVFSKSPEKPVYHFDYNKNAEWEREASTTAKADKP